MDLPTFDIHLDLSWTCLPSSTLHQQESLTHMPIHHTSAPSLHHPQYIHQPIQHSSSPAHPFIMPHLPHIPDIRHGPSFQPFLCPTHTSHLRILAPSPTPPSCQSTCSSLSQSGTGFTSPECNLASNSSIVHPDLISDLGLSGLHHRHDMTHPRPPAHHQFST